MKLGIMQPYFFPYLGYFSLIKHTDKFILLDAVQFIRHGWIERNRILNPFDGWQYIQVPLKKHSRETKIWEIEINNEQAWKEKIIAQLQHYRKVSPYYSVVIGIIKKVFSQEYTKIVSLNRATLQSICDYLEIRTPIEVYSKMRLEIAPVNTPDEWALNICKAINGVTEYWNPPGGINIFDRLKYEKNHIGLKFLSINSEEYDQKRPGFEPNLSILDCIMFNSPKKIREMLNQYELL